MVALCQKSSFEGHCNSLSASGFNSGLIIGSRALCKLQLLKLFAVRIDHLDFIERESGEVSGIACKRYCGNGAAAGIWGGADCGYSDDPRARDVYCEQGPGKEVASSYLWSNHCRTAITHTDFDASNSVQVGSLQDIIPIACIDYTHR